MNRQTDLLNGNLPNAWVNAKNEYYNRTYENTLGNQLSKLASKGVINSSRMNTATNDMQKNLASQMSSDYTNDVNLMENMLNQRMSWLKQPIQNAYTAHQSTLGDVNGLLGTAAALQHGNTQALSAIGNNENSSTSVGQQANSNPWGDLFGNLVGVGSLFVKH